MDKLIKVAVTFDFEVPESMLEEFEKSIANPNTHFAFSISKDRWSYDAQGNYTGFRYVD